MVAKQKIIKDSTVIRYASETPFSGVKKEKKKEFNKNVHSKKHYKRLKDEEIIAKEQRLLLTEEAGYLEAEGLEKTYNFTQKEIKENVDVGTANKAFALKLNEFGPYTLDYTTNGRKLLIGGKKGHVASMDWRQGTLDCELHLNETVNAVKYFHNEQYFAVAQKKYTFVYNKEGVELHRLSQHIEATSLDFLPYHFLLVSAGNTGFLKYHDVSTGEMVSEFRTKLGPTVSMRQNPWNAVINLGHANGQVTLWIPNSSTPVAKLQVCRGPVRSLAVSRDGRYMACSGADKSLKIWDIRKLSNLKEMESYYTPTPANSLDISDTGLLSIGWGPHVTVWKDILKTRQKSPYMNHLIPGSQIQTVRYVPFEDILGVGHNDGISSLIIPGSGEANFDALEANPYETSEQRKDKEVTSLLNKLSPDLIAYDPFSLGLVGKKARDTIKLKKDYLAKLTGETAKKEGQPEAKKESRGRISAVRRHLRKKNNNVIDQRRVRLERNLKREKELRQKKLESKNVEEETDLFAPAFSRFK
ncbi:Utp7p [Ascoidea rubescens DSM 1968]|uniref:U three protein 7 n=1 Tax=Ascoidea rubescens DSM 1968 TaxID=1344418 RepID=A0A1D2VCP7_9ASCO|nr:BING4CT-domain-containing protein [Ascoidea rubescens DSM 1968]ODV59237.1 BING4CT-domain-containing protein [Ascoidea rubescens DSM 1968]